MASITITSKPPFRDSTTTLAAAALPREFKKPRSHSFSSGNTTYNNNNSLNMIRSTAKESSRRVTLGSLPHPLDPSVNLSSRSSSSSGTLHAMSNPKKHAGAARPRLFSVHDTDRPSMTVLALDLSRG